MHNNPQRARYVVEIQLDPATPDLTNHGGETFKPTVADIRWEWSPADGWQRWINVVGYRRRKDGSIGVRTAYHMETPFSPDYWRLPAEYQALADATTPTHFPLPA